MKKFFAVMATVLLVTLGAATLVSCDSGIHDCCAFGMSVDNLADLKIIFGTDYLYSTTGKTNRITVGCPQSSQTLNGYENKVEYIPFLNNAQYYDVFGNYEIFSAIFKNQEQEDEENYSPIRETETIDGVKYFYLVNEFGCQTNFYYQNNCYIAMISFPDNMPEEGEERENAVKNIKRITIDYLLQLK